MSKDEYLISLRRQIYILFLENLNQKSIDIMSSKPPPANSPPVQTSQSSATSKLLQQERSTPSPSTTPPASAPAAQQPPSTTLTTAPPKGPKLPTLDGLNWLLHVFYTRKDFKACKDLIKDQLGQTNGMCEYALYIQGSI